MGSRWIPGTGHKFKILPPPYLKRKVWNLTFILCNRLKKELENTMSWSQETCVNEFVKDFRMRFILFLFFSVNIKFNSKLFEWLQLKLNVNQIRIMLQLNFTNRGKETSKINTNCKRVIWTHGQMSRNKLFINWERRN